jgi:hypothetical protein
MAFHLPEAAVVTAPLVMTVLLSRHWLQALDACEGPSHDARGNHR